MADGPAVQPKMGSTPYDGGERTMHAPTSFPNEHQLLPDVALISSEGQTIRASDYRGQCSLVLVFVGRSTGGEVRPLLGGCAEQYTAFREWTAEVLAVIQGTPQEAIHVKRCEALPFPVLADADGGIGRSAL
jgi:peroxiredoxin